MSDVTMCQTFGLRVRALREARGMTQDALARPAGMDPNYLSQIEAGKKNPTLKSICKLTDGLGVSLASFFDDDRFRELGEYAYLYGQTEPLDVVLPSGNTAWMRRIDRDVLDLIKGDQSITMGDMADKLSVSYPTVARAVSRLKASGTVSREGSPRTGRWVVAS